VRLRKPTAEQVAYGVLAWPILCALVAKIIGGSLAGSIGLALAFGPFLAILGATAVIAAWRRIMPPSPGAPYTPAQPE
jgi:hypothetical protein